MGWELVLVCTVYRYTEWRSGLRLDVKPVAERVFGSRFAAPLREEKLSKALKDCCDQAQSWLATVRPNLVEEVVVTVYSLEADLDDAPSSN